MKKYRKVTASYIMDQLGSFENWKQFVESQALYDFGGNYEVDGKDHYFAMATDNNKKFVKAYKLEPGEEMIDGRIYNADNTWCAESYERLVCLEKMED